jgi:glycosyltransferase involved in cell wall biosynthesis
MIDRVEFLGWVGRSDVHRIMRDRAHAFVFPSLHDDAPWVVGEAVAHGLPVVCLDRGGTPIIAGERGVQVGNVKAMAAALAKALAETQTMTPSTSWDIDTRYRDLLSILRKSNLLRGARDVTPSTDEADP